MTALRTIFAAVLLLVGLQAGARAETVNVVTVSGGINPAVGDYLRKAIALSEGDGAHALVIELDTPGGLLSSTKDIVSDILNAEIPVIVFVSPRGAWAGSAGTFITMAGHVAAMAPGTSIGAAHPVPALPTGEPPKVPGQPDEEGDDESEAPRVRDVQGEKIENFTAAFIESIAETRDRNVEWAIDAVRNSVAITQKEAIELNVVDLGAEDLDHLLELIDGREVEVARDTVTLRTANATIVRIQMGVVNRFFDVIADPTIATLLILAGMLGLYVEFTQPGMIFPGVAGVVSLILAGLSLQIIPFNWIGLLLIATGIALMAAEIFVASFGLLFAGGVACLAVGGYVLFDVPDASDLSVPFWRVIAPAVVGFSLVGAMIVIGVSRSFARPQFAGSEGMIGDLAVADSDIDPEGRVFLHGEYWNAVSDETISAGESVEILSVDSLQVRVARPSDATKGNS
ncbi:MAG: nodulation protein NfeD [Deltaproteobacteria bacterium]|nr:nodulation protein NfeD [Deltaproteobacteria bacterium]